MNDSTQVFFIIISSIIAATLIVGVILLSICLFRIKAALKNRNKLIVQTSRPYFVCQKHGNQLVIQNLGTTWGQIDNSQTDSEHDFSFLNQSYLLAGQSFTYNIVETDQFKIDLTYHGLIDTYTESFQI